MNILKILYTVFFISIGLGIQAQENNDIIKSLEYKIYKVKIVDGKIIKKKTGYLYKGYPIRYPSSKFFFSKDRKIIKEDHSYQTDTTYYNFNHQKVKMVLYPEGKKDSITFKYAYDEHGNLESVRKKASAPKMDFSLEGNHYSYTALIDEFYKNFYLTKDDPDVSNQFETTMPEENYTYRLYNDKNQLVQIKNLYDSGTRIRTIKYQYDEENRIVKESTSDTYLNLSSRNTTTKKEEHKYFKGGLVHEIKHFSNGNVWREEQITHNSKGILVKYSTIRNKLKKPIYIIQTEI